MIKYIKRMIYPLASRYISRAILVEGFLKGTKIPFKCLFVDNSIFSKSMMARMYDEPPMVLRKWRVWHPSLKKLVLGKTESFDLCIAVLPKFYDSEFQGLYDYKCTEYVRQIIDVSDSWEDVRNRFSKSKRQITNKFVEKFNLEYRISSDMQDFDFFYHRMFVPHISKRFKDMSKIDLYENMKKFFCKGRLLLITKSGETVAGALFLIVDGALVFRRTGVLDGDESHIKSGAQLALYYFQLKYAIDQKLHTVDTMLSSSFLNDGVYKNKREWGARVCPDDKAANWIYFFNAAPSAKIAKYFEINPLIVESSGGLKGVIGIADESIVSAESTRERACQYNSRGLDGYAIVTPTGSFELAAAQCFNKTVS